MKFVSSNEGKLNEYAQYGLKMELLKGADLPEIKSTDSALVTLYKSMAAGKDTVIEDTSLFVDYAEVGTDIRWLLQDITQYKGYFARWIVWLCENDGKYLKLYKGVINGILVGDALIENSFGFDSVFKPIGSGLTLHELNAIGRKAEFSARKLAAEALNQNKPDKVILASLPTWTGEYQ